MRLIGTLGELSDGRGSVRVEDSFDTGIEDLWEACTVPDRLARWIAEVDGELCLGGQFRARFTSGWEGTGRVEVCDPPHRLTVITKETGESSESVIEATLSVDGDRTVLVVEERGVPVDHLPDYGAGWQLHLEDLGAHLAGRDRGDIAARWAPLAAEYRATVD